MAQSPSSVSDGGAGSLRDLPNAHLMSTYVDLVNEHARVQLQRDEIAAEIVRRYQSRLLALARTLMHSQLKQKEGVSAMVQSVLANILVSPDFLADRDDETENLWGILAYRLECKLYDYLRRYKPKGKRDFNVEVSMSSPNVPEPAHDQAAWEEILNDIREGLTDDEYALVELYIAGASVAEMAAEAKVSVDTIYLRTRNLKAKIKLLLNPGSDA